MLSRGIENNHGHKRNGLKKSRSSRPEVFCKKGQTHNFIKKRLWHRCFPVNFAKFLRTAFYRTPLLAASESHRHYKHLFFNKDLDIKALRCILVEILKNAANSGF